MSGSRKDHILATIFYQSLCHWGPETSGSVTDVSIYIYDWYVVLSRGFPTLFQNSLCRVFIDCSRPLVIQGCLIIIFLLIVIFLAHKLVNSVPCLVIKLSYVEFMSLSLDMLFQSVFSRDLIFMLICSSFIGLHVHFKVSGFWLIVVPKHAKIGRWSDMSVTMIPDLRFSSLLCLI